MRIIAVGGGPEPASWSGPLKGRFPDAEVVDVPFDPRAVQRAAAFQPDIVIVDPPVDGGDGMELRALLCSGPATRGPRVLLVVPRGWPPARRAGALDAGAHALIEGPVDPEELAALVAATIRSRSDPSRDLLEQAEEGVFVHDANGRFRDANRRALESLGYTREELLGLTLADVEEGFWLEGARAAWRRIARGLPATRIGRHVRKDGTRFQVEVRLGRLEGGGEELFLAFVRDVAASEEAGAALRDSERMFTAAFRSSPVASLLTSLPEGKLIAVNEVFLRDMGYGRDEVIGRTADELGLFAEEAEKEAVLSEVRVAGGVYGRECRFRTRSGAILTCLLSIDRVTIGGRKCLLSSVLDISGRKNHEESLRESEARFRAAFEDVNLSVCLLSLDGGFLKVNDAACRTLGHDRERLLSMTIADVSHPEDRAISPAHMTRALAEEAGHSAFVKRYVRPDGTVVWGQVSSSLVRGAKGEPLYFISHLQDITELKQAQHDLEDLSAALERRVGERTAELQSANRELESFSYSISHDLRAPLRAIDGFSKRLVDRCRPHMDAEGLRLAGVIRSNTQRMAELIDDLLAFSRTSRGELRYGVVRSAALALAAFLEVTPDAAVRDRIVFTVGDLPDAWGDAKLLRQVWINLLSNAVKFSARTEAPRIDVTGGVDGDRTVYEVRDNGVGFDMAYAPKLFGVFQRLHGMTEFEGTGVGLALVERIVSRHGGEVKAEGKVGVGASFSFRLPLRREPAGGRRSGKFVPVGTA